MNIGKIKPISLTKETAYLAGVIIGDGHISASTKSKMDKSKDYKIVIDLCDKSYLNLIYLLISSIIRTKSTPKVPKIRGNRKGRLYFQFRNKSLFYFLTESLGIPQGAKSSTVSIPDKIKDSSEDIKKYFLAGIFDTDGGFRGNGIGFTTASKKLNQEISILLGKLLIKHALEEWKNNKYDRIYYGIKISKTEIGKFLNTLPLQNKEKLIRICKRFNAGMPEWSNGIVYSNQLVE